MAQREDSTEYLLEKWGIWARIGVGNLNNAAPSWSLPTVRLTDDQALEIDRLVALLGVRHPERGEALIRYYTTGKTYKQVGASLGMGEERARQTVMAGVAWVDGALEAKRSKLAA